MQRERLAMDVEAAVAAEDETKPLLGAKSGSIAISSTSADVVKSIASLPDHFGSRLLIMLFASQHLMKGFAASFTGPAQLWLYASYNVPGPQMQIYGGVTQLPWAMKPIIGLMSDLMPVMGFHKMPYMFLTTMLGIMACGTVGLVSQDQLSLTNLVGCLFVMSLMFSTVDLLTEAKYAEKMRSKPEHGPALMSYVWGGMTVGSLVAMCLVGIVLTRWGAKAPFVIALVPICVIFFPLLGNYLDEKIKSTSELVEARERMMSQYEASLLCLLMFVATISMAILGIYVPSPAVNAVAALIVAFVMLLSFSVVLRPIIAKVNAFSLIQTSLHFSIGGASFYFYTDTPESFPEGPHFSKEFYTSVLGIVGTFCSLLGIISYQKYATTWSYRRLFITTNLVLGVLAMLDVIFYARLNVRIGIPDQVFVIGTVAFEDAIFAWMWMPGVVLMSNLCPEGMEATMFALLAGCHNLGNSIAASCGALVLQWLGCQPSGMPGESKQFENLWLAALLSVILPLCAASLVPWLIPDAKQTEKLLPDGDRDATKGSLLRRWQGREEE